MMKKQKITGPILEKTNLKVTKTVMTVIVKRKRKGGKIKKEKSIVDIKEIRKNTTKIENRKKRRVMTTLRMKQTIMTKINKEVRRETRKIKV